MAYVLIPEPRCPQRAFANRSKWQHVGGFRGEWQKAPSGINQEKKLDLLRGEGVLFDEMGKLVDRSRLWAAFVL